MKSDAATEVAFFLKTALPTWLIFFGAALVGSSVANGLFAIPFGSVVDVLLSIQLIVVGIWAFAIIASVFLFVSRGTLLTLAGLLALLICALLPFAAILGFKVYASLAGVDLSDASFVYLPLVRFYASTLSSWGMLPEHFLDPVVLGLIPIDQLPDDAHRSSVAIDQVEFILIFVSVALSVLTSLIWRGLSPSRSEA